MEDKLVTELMGLIADVNPEEIAAHIADGTLFAWTQTWRMKASMVAGFLNEMLIRRTNYEQD